MKKTIALLFAVALVVTAQEKTFTGVITDSMCGASHQMMKVTPDAKCVRECMKVSSTVKLALYDGQHTYVLSDQKTPDQFAGQKVKVTGTLSAKTGIIDVKKIEAAK